MFLNMEVVFLKKTVLWQVRAIMWMVVVIFISYLAVNFFFFLQNEYINTNNMQLCYV